jgi:uncharacterized protein involved in exopolysaccharide biosynthesis
MEEFSDRILSALKGSRKYRWWTVALSWMVFVVGTAVVLLLPDTYQATARVYVDTAATDTNGGSALNVTVPRILTNLSGNLSRESIWKTG